MVSQNYFSLFGSLGGVERAMNYLPYIEWLKKMLEYSNINQMKVYIL
jgi:hypothetical protein